MGFLRFAFWENLKTTGIVVSGPMLIVLGAIKGNALGIIAGAVALVFGGAWWLWDWRRAQRGDTRGLS